MPAARPNQSWRETLKLPITLPLGGTGVTAAIISAATRPRTRRPS
jgi:hypothetical protein